MNTITQTAAIELIHSGRQNHRLLGENYSAITPDEAESLVELEMNGRCSQHPTMILDVTDEHIYIDRHGHGRSNQGCRYRLHDPRA